jgi:hypothetical protein
MKYWVNSLIDEFWGQLQHKVGGSQVGLYYFVGANESRQQFAGSSF